MIEAEQTSPRKTVLPAIHPGQEVPASMMVVGGGVGGGGGDGNSGSGDDGSGVGPLVVVVMTMIVMILDKIVPAQCDNENED